MPTRPHEVMTTRPLCGHRLHINIELKPRALFVDEATTFVEIVIKIDDLICDNGVGNALYIDYTGSPSSLLLHEEIDDAAETRLRHND
jgi:hypothetical protein